MTLDTHLHELIMISHSIIHMIDHLGSPAIIFFLFPSFFDFVPTISARWGGLGGRIQLGWIWPREIALNG